ncbi:hypothetical protein M6B38_281930 [Iris pallida]|uniref:RNase H type-1 domain-containing protein n=1 Tax=Iris pallida TaxID=29817 RepID=A0AAX6HZT5_IRIPA|nr:hypothetical protein M6B38_327815 [Iris pallida]KAJ6846519.1 hypothetical protein M6B38_281930 [Iris pallida]
METFTVSHLHGQNTPTKMSKARSFDQLAAAGATPTTGYEPACKLRRTLSATSSRESLYHLEYSHDYWSTEGDSSTMESNLQTKQDMVCRMCTCEIDHLHDYEREPSKASKMYEGRVCKTCVIIAEYTPGYESSKETLLTEEEHNLISEEEVMKLRRKQLCLILPEIKLMVRNSRSRTTGEKPSSGNLSSKDEDKFDSDEEIDIPTVQGWFELLTSKQQETNGEEAILALVAKVKELEMSQAKFYIHIDAFYSIEDRSSRQGAVLYDFDNRPIAAWSNIDSNVEFISRLHNELKGLSLGLEMAMQYQVTNFYIYCPSSEVIMILRGLNCPCSKTKPGACPECALPLLRNKEETYQLLSQIFRLIEQLNFPLINIHFIDEERNKVAHLMAELGEIRKMDLSEIKKHETLSKILYSEFFEFFHR